MHKLEVIEMTKIEKASLQMIRNHIDKGYRLMQAFRQSMIRKHGFVGSGTSVEIEFEDKYMLIRTFPMSPITSTIIKNRKKDKRRKGSV